MNKNYTLNKLDKNEKKLYKKKLLGNMDVVKANRSRKQPF